MEKKSINLRNLKGTRDYLNEEYASMRALRNGLQEVLASHGFLQIDTPVLEPAELYLLKSGAEVASRLYTFTDLGGVRVALRPEFTASVIRAYVEKEESERHHPVRWQYCGPVFRYGPQEETPLRQFTQLGAELIRGAGPAADAEMVSLAYKGIKESSVSGQQLVGGDVGIILGLLRGLGLSDRAVAFLARSIGELRQGEGGMDRVRDLSRTLGFERSKDGNHVLGLATDGMNEEEARTTLLGLMKGMEGEAGGRDREEIVARFLRKTGRGDDSALMEKGIQAISRLSAIRGNPSKAVAECRSLISDMGLSELNDALTSNLEKIISALMDSGISESELIIDLGLSRDLAYYTGIVFEIHHPSLPNGGALCGGGRYDGLVKALGGEEDTPAIGFAYSLENVQQAVGCVDKLQAKQAVRTSDVATSPPQ